MRKFTHLHLHTQYSLLDGFSKIDKVLDRAQEYGMDSVAITDHGVMFGVVEFYKKAKAKGIKPIIGCEIYVSEQSHLIKTRENKRYHLVLLAENNEGYHNLVKIVSEAYVHGFYYKPRVDKEFLKKYSKGIICLSACLSGEVQEYLKYDDYEGAKKAAKEYNQIFGQNNFYLEIQDHGLPEQKKVNILQKRLSEELNIPMVATNDVHYTDQEDSKAQDVLLAIGTAATINQTNRMSFPNSQFYFKKPEEMYELFSDYPQALENTNLIADRCNITLDFDTMHLPNFTVDKDHDQYLRELVYKGLEARYEELDKEITERADYELNMIQQMGFTDYFLIVWDFIDYAKKHDIPVGPGRGSAAGSLVAYALGITGLDPLKYDLLFERFLNPERVSMPDIDIDFCYERRDEVIDYVKAKYGEEKVAQIVTFGTMAARNAIRDVGRVLDIDYAKVDKIAKLIPQELDITIEKALVQSEEFRKAYQEDQTSRELIDMAKEVEGMPRHTSTHAAGVVIASKAVDEFVPLLRNGDQISTQYNMIELEELGLLKMDFLGLRTLTVISDAIKQVKYNRGIDVDIDNIDLEDKKVLELFNKAETIGIFQFESAGMRNFLSKLKPSRFDDLIAANSLFRPGPMNEIPNYIKNRHNPEEITYLHPMLESILKASYGTIVFQEQVMQIVQKLAGFSLGEADNLRRAMGKKKMEIMEENREYFVNGRVNNGVVEIEGTSRKGIDPKIANKIYDLMIDFAKYAFNKSHSAAYSLVAMQTAYLKVYYPEEFMAALLSSVMGNASKVYLYIKEAKSMGIDILLPCVNSSYGKFSVDKGKIRIGLDAIKTVGHNIIKSIVDERKENGLFTSFENFVERMVQDDKASLTKSYLEALILSGALDSFGLKRSQMMRIYPNVYESYLDRGKNNLLGQEDIFSMLDESSKNFDIPDIDEFPKREFLNYEKEYLGVYITDHPYSEYGELVKSLVNFTSLDLMDENKNLDNKYVVFGGLVTSVKKIITRKNQAMAFLEMEDDYGTIEVVVFPNYYEKFKSLMLEDKALLIKGRLQISDDKNPSIILNEVTEINKENFSKSSQTNGIMEDDTNLYLKLLSNDKEKYKKVKNVLLAYKGENEVFVYFEDLKNMYSLKSIQVNLKDKSLLSELENLLGKDNIVIK
ncbi:DNA polymerase III subunit alpha [uncultured Helcococcus sp.]|uniref:DNA polymerase III subunit alpha n=1 Tax=uncultured Helcococcus sp. TaxID=1072508 RepID=UPI00262AE3AC|nr:DNA polymerase III subunit alpha [uncultured Helcococcus sp.]